MSEGLAEAGRQVPEDVGKNNTKFVSTVTFVVPGGPFTHVIALCQLHLYRVKTLPGFTIVTSRPAALEPTIGNSPEIGSADAGGLNRCLDCRGTTFSTIAADVEIRQFTFE